MTGPPGFWLHFWQAASGSQFDVKQQRLAAVEVQPGQVELNLDGSNSTWTARSRVGPG